MTSRTKVMGRHVEITMKALAGETGVRAIMSCKQIAEACGLTKPTARKYLNILVEHQVVIRYDNQTRGAFDYQLSEDV